MRCHAAVSWFLLILSSSFSAEGQSVQLSFNVAFFVPGVEKGGLKTALEAFLNEEVGKGQDPPWTFTAIPFMYNDGEPGKEELFASTEIDFTFAPAALSTCTGAEHWQVLLSAGIAGLVVACVAARAVHGARRRRLSEGKRAWRVQREDLVFDEPATLLGVGSTGEVLRAKYLGTEVAVKVLGGSSWDNTDLHRANAELNRALSSHSSAFTPGNASSSSAIKQRLTLLARLQALDLPLRRSPSHKSASVRGAGSSLAGVGADARGAEEGAGGREGGGAAGGKEGGGIWGKDGAGVEGQRRARDTWPRHVATADTWPLQQQQQQQPQRQLRTSSSDRSLLAATSSTATTVLRAPSSMSRNSSAAAPSALAATLSFTSPPSQAGQTSAWTQPHTNTHGHAHTHAHTRSRPGSLNNSPAASRPSSMGFKLQSSLHGPSSPFLRGASSSPVARGSLGARSSLRRGSSLVSSIGSLEERGSGFAALVSRDGVSKSERRRREEAFVAEIELLAAIRHPRVTMVIGAVLDAGGPLLVTELMLYGSLLDLYLNTTINFDGAIVHSILLDVAQGVEFLHSHTPAIVHGDLKAANILIDEKFRAKVSDFGIALRRGGEGTPYWMGPDRLEGGPPIKSSDAYGFGVTMCETMARAPPFEGEAPLEVLTRVCDPDTQLRPEIPRGCGARLARLMRSCWNHNPANRPTMAQVRAELAAMDMGEYEGLWGWQQPRPEAPGARCCSESTASSQLMHACFPPHVAEVLLRGEVPGEDRSECATIFFADVAGFTAISATMESGKVSNMISRLFLRFDELAAQHEVYKLETIGDCYMAVANLVSAQSTDHVVRVANFSLDVIQAARETLIDEDDPSKGHIELRVGFDAGPVVGNVVGTRHKKYTVFGNTVNTASRMESTGVPGRIQCTKRAARLLQQQDPHFGLMARGSVAVKGRGTMRTYFVEAKAPSAAIGELELQDLFEDSLTQDAALSFRRRSSGPGPAAAPTSGLDSESLPVAAPANLDALASGPRGSGPLAPTSAAKLGCSLSAAGPGELPVGPSTPAHCQADDQDRDQDGTAPTRTTVRGEAAEGTRMVTVAAVEMSVARDSDSDRDDARASGSDCSGEPAIAVQGRDQPLQGRDQPLQGRDQPLERIEPRVTASERGAGLPAGSGPTLSQAALLSESE